MKIHDILKSDKTYQEKFDEAKEQYLKAIEWIDSQTLETAEKYYEMLRETLEGVRHLYCMVELGYDPMEEQ